MEALDSCDDCGGSPAQTVRFVTASETVEKDLCGSHVSEALEGATVLPPSVRPQDRSDRASVRTRP